MERQNKFTSRQSKTSNRKSVSSQMKTSLPAQNNRQKQTILKNNNNLDLQKIYSVKTGGLSPIYIDTFNKLSTKAVMHVGLCLQMEQIMFVLKQLFLQTNKSTNGLSKFFQKRDSLQGLYFVPYWNYKAQNCTIIFWIIESSTLKKSINIKQYEKWVKIFTQYPQIILTDASSYQILRNKRIRDFNNLYSFEQHIYLVKQKQKNKNVNLNDKNKEKENPQNYKIGYMQELDKKQIKNAISFALKKNCERCFQQVLKINLYILQSLLMFISKLGSQLNLYKMQLVLEILDIAASNYLSVEIQKKYNETTQSIKNELPIDQKQLENKLNEYEQQLSRQVKRNLKLLRQPQKQRQLIQATQKKISLNNQQLLTVNRQLIKKQNNQLISQLYQKLLGQFDKGKYVSTNYRSKQMAQDLKNLMQNYQKQAVQSASLFWVFNTFIRNNKNRYYQKIQELQQRIDENKKINTNFDQTLNMIQSNKNYLFKLEKSVKDLQAKKKRVQAQNQNLKNLQRQLNQKGHIQSEDDDIQQGESMKNFKNKKLSPRSKSNKPGLKSKQSMSPFNIQKNTKAKQKTKKTCCSCRCAIF